MATLTIQAPKFIESDFGSPPRVRSGYYEANTQSFIEGALVYLSSETVTACSTDPTSIAGIALKAGTNVSTGNIEIKFEEIRSQDTYLMNLYHATAASALQSGVSVGATYEIIQDPTTGHWCVDMAATTNERVVIVRKHPSDATTDVYGRVWVKFLNTALDNTTQRNNVLQFSG